MVLISVYSYRGIGSSRANELLKEAGVGIEETYNSTENSLLKTKLFKMLFETKFMLRVCQGDSARYFLHREFSIFLENGRYVLLAGICTLNVCHLTMSDCELYPDLFDKLDQFWYIFFVVDLELGIVTDEMQLPKDAICLSHNHGISVYGHTIAILSRLRQAIYLYEFVNGRLVKQEHEIGTRPRNCTFKVVSSGTVLDVNTLLPITHIKQRVLSFLYRQIYSEVPQSGQKYKSFYKNFNFVS